ncbi:MAG TPA: diguanylate cyclase, partial [Pseudomonadales bacterium]|nr:diguanylate cyclase [Pseudomonadales bacterium]
MSDTAVTRILVLTDPGHVAAINSALSGTETLYEIRYAVSQQDFIHAFNSADWDLIAASFDYPHGCVEILTWVRHIDPYVPFIILADKETDALSNVVIHHKANDYIIKSNLIRLPALIHRECSRYHQLKKMAGISTSIRTLNAISDAVITTDAHCRIISMNPAAEKLLKLNNAEARGRLLTETVRLLDETSGNQVSCAELVKQQRRTTLKIAPPQSSTPHSPCYVEISASELKLDQELQQHYVLVFHDITETRRLLHQLSHDASHDPLTNLINRREFEKRLNRFLNKANPQHCGVLLFFDLDQFKVVNDTSGHHAGDELLRQV